MQLSKPPYLPYVCKTDKRILKADCNDKPPPQHTCINPKQLSCEKDCSSSKNTTVKLQDGTQEMAVMIG